jgi:hypothetical protein
VDRPERGIAGLDQLFAFVWRHLPRQRHEAVLKKRVDRPRGFDCEPGKQLDRLLQVLFALRQHRGHLLQPLGRGQSAGPRCVVFLFQEGENAVRAFAHIQLRIGFLRLQDTAPKVEVFELGAEEQPVDSIVLGPLRGRHRADLVEQLADMLAALGDLRRGIVGQAVVPGVETGIARSDGKIFISPGVEVLGQLSKRSNVVPALRGKSLFRQERLVRDVRARIRRRLRQ